MAARRKTIARVKLDDFVQATHDLEQRLDLATVRQTNIDFEVLRRYAPALKLAEKNPELPPTAPECRALDILVEAGLVDRMPPFTMRRKTGAPITYMTRLSQRVLVLEDELRKLKAKFE